MRSSSISTEGMNYLGDSPTIRSDIFKDLNLILEFNLWLVFKVAPLVKEIVATSWKSSAGCMSESTGR